MSDPESTPYGNHFKAKIALEALKGASLETLSEEHEVPVADIEKWAAQLENRAELLFLEGDPASRKVESVDSGIRDYAALLRATLEATPSGLLVADLDMNVIAYNEYCLEMWGVPEHIAAKGDLDEIMAYILPQLKDPESFVENVKKLYENPRQQSQKLLEFKDGRVFQRHSIPFYQDNRVAGRVSSFTDITEFKKAQHKIERYSKLLSSITTNVNEGILRSTPEDGLIYVNDAFVSMFGYDSRQEVLDTDPQEFYANQNHRWELVEKLKSEGSLINEEVLFKRKDGTTFYALENSTLIEEEDQVYIDAVINDINDRKEAEEALRQSEEKYRTILNNIEDGYFETDLAGNFTFVNPAVERILGYSEEELIGMNNMDYMDEKNARSVYKAFNEVYHTGESRKGFDWELCSKDGRKISVEASFNLLRDADGEPVGFRGVVRDITDRKEKERKIRNSLKEKEILLGEIHHRVKNNLAVISGLLFLQAEKTDTEAGRNLLQQSQGRINSMAIVHELLYENHNFSSIDPNKYINQLIMHISNNLSGGDQDITTNITTDDLQLDMNVAIPCALIINELLTNAYKYAFEDSGSGTIDISITRQGSNYLLVVEDDGKGLPDDFDPDQSGSGLGMFLVKTLAQQVQGELEISGNDGTRVAITFPVDQE